MQNTMQTFRQSSIVFEEPGIFVWKFENFEELQLSYSSIFFAETSHMFSTYHCQKKGFLVFFILFRSWVICKIIKRPGFYKLFFYIFIDNSRSKQNKKKFHTLFCRHYQVEIACKLSVKNIKIYGSWSSSKFSTFQTKCLVSSK